MMEGLVPVPGAEEGGKGVYLDDLAHGTGKTRVGMETHTSFPGGRGEDGGEERMEIRMFRLVTIHKAVIRGMAGVDLASPEGGSHVQRVRYVSALLPLPLGVVLLSFLSSSHCSPRNPTESKTITSQVVRAQLWGLVWGLVSGCGWKDVDER